MIREYLREIGLHIHSQSFGWYPRKRADAYEIRLCLHVVLVRIPCAGAVQLWTTIFKHLIQLSAAPVNSTDPCTYEKKFVNSLEVLIRSNRYEKMQFQDELNSPWNAISKAVIVFLFLPFFSFLLFTSLHGGSRICWWCCDSGPALFAYRRPLVEGQRSPVPGMPLELKSGSPWAGGRRENVSLLRCSCSAGSSTCRPLRVKRGKWVRS